MPSFANAECLTFYDSKASSISVDAINAITLIWVDT